MGVIDGLVLQGGADALGGGVQPLRGVPIGVKYLGDQVGQAGVYVQIGVIDKGPVDRLRLEIVLLGLGLGPGKPVGLLEQLPGQGAGAFGEPVRAQPQNAGSAYRAVFLAGEGLIGKREQRVGQTEPGAVSGDILHRDDVLRRFGLLPGGEERAVLADGLQVLPLQPGEQAGVLPGVSRAGQWLPDPVLIPAPHIAPEIDVLLLLGADSQHGVRAGLHLLGVAQVAFGQTVGAIAQGVDGLDSVGPGGIYPLEGPAGQDQGQGHGDRRETDQPVQQGEGQGVEALEADGDQGADKSDGNGPDHAAIGGGVPHQHSQNQQQPQQKQV